MIANKEDRILSGPGSKKLWRDINKVRNFDETTHTAIFHLACRCQELETVIRNLQERLGQLEQERR
jgi:hypothetical protein